MQISNMSQPVMGKASGMMMKTNAGSNEDAGSIFQSLLETNANEKTGKGLASIYGLNSNNESEENRASLLELMTNESFEKDLLGSMMQQLESGMSLEEVTAQFDMQEIKNLMKDNPGLAEKHPLLASLLELSNINGQAEKNKAADELIAKWQDAFQELKNKPTEPISANVQQVMSSVEEVHPAELKAHIQQVLSEVSRLLVNYQADGKLAKADAAKLTALLKEWSLLMRQAKGADVNTAKLQNQMLDENESELWNKLLQRFDKRSFYAGKNMYTGEANVSRQDVMNWLQQASENQAQYETRPTHFVQHEQQMPMAKVEQHVVHLEQTGRVERVGPELVDKFASIISKSQFLSTTSGKMELNLMLRPENLGNIQVKMTQVNGEMMVKLIVSSQAAKEMLEQNMHQLRHLFSPHQVTVDRNELVTDDEFYLSDEDKEQDSDGQDAEENNEHQDQSDDRPELDFETVFNDVSEEDS